jgi:hypothetical protein
MSTFLVDSKCPRIYYSYFNYRNTVGIRGRILSRVDSSIAEKRCHFSAAPSLSKSDIPGFNFSHSSSNSSCSSSSSSSIYPTLAHCKTPIHSSAKNAKHLNGRTSDAEMGTLGYPVQ